MTTSRTPVAAYPAARTNRTAAAALHHDGVPVAHELRGAPARGGAAAHAHEERGLGHGEQGLGDGGLRRERIDGKDRVGVGVADRGDVGRVEERPDATPEEREAAALLVVVRHAQRRLAQAALDRHGAVGGGDQLVGRVTHLEDAGAQGPGDALLGRLVVLDVRVLHGPSRVSHAFSHCFVPRRRGSYTLLLGVRLELRRHLAQELADRQVLRAGPLAGAAAHALRG